MGMRLRVGSTASPLAWCGPIHPPLPSSVCFLDYRANSFIPSLRSGRLIDPSEEVALMTDGQRLEVLYCSLGSEGVHKILRDGDLSGPIANRDLHSYAISHPDV